MRRIGEGMATAPRILRRLKISEISSVDEGAGRGVRVLLTKRMEQPELYNKPLTFGREIGAEAEAYVKREFTQAERDSAAASGAAMSDGSFPIHNKGDLKNAVQAISRAKDPAKAKAHIKARAAALGATDELPESWSKRAPTAKDVIAFMRDQVSKGAVDFDQANEMIEAAEDADDVLCEIREACMALDCSLTSILQDEDVADKATAIAESLTQFKDHIAAIEAGGDDSTEKSMTPEQLKKQIDDAVAAALAPAIAKASAEKDAIIAKQTRDIAVAKMADKHRSYHSSLDDAAQKKFEDMSVDDRDAELERTKKRAEDDPIYKAMRTENDDLKKRLTAIEDERALDIAKRDAKELGMSTTDAGETLMKARRGDVEAIKKLEGHISTLAKAKTAIEKTGHIFSEFGHNQGTQGDGTALAELQAKAAELRKVKPDLTEAQAFEKVMTDPANREIVGRERDERMNKIHRVA